MTIDTPLVAAGSFIGQAEKEVSLKSRPSKFHGCYDRAAPVRFGDYRGWVSQRYLEHGFQPALHAFLTGGTHPQQAVKSRRDSQVYRFDYKGDTFYVKQYPINGVKAFLLSFFGQNKAQKTWRFARLLLAKGLSTPPPVFYVLRNITCMKSEHMVGTLGIDRSISLRDFIQSHFKPGNVSTSDKRRFIKKLAVFMARLHLAGIYHGDLTARNIIVKPAGDVYESQLYLIDLDAIRSTRWISDRRRVKNLDELGRNFLDLSIVDGLDRACFLKHYLGTYTRDRWGFRSSMERIQARTGYRLERHGQQFHKTGKRKASGHDDRS